MAAAYVQSSNTFSAANGNTWNTAFTSGITSGNLIVVAVAGQAYLTPLAFSVTDTLGTTYTAGVTMTASIGGSPFVSTIFYGVAPSGGSNTVTVNYPTTGGAATSYNRILIHEYSGVDSLDQFTSANGNGSTLNAGNMTTTQADEVVFGWMVSNAGVSSAGTGFTVRETSGSESSIDKIVTSTGTYAPVANGAGSDDWMALGAAFGLGISGGGDPDPTDTDPIVSDIGPTTSATAVNVGGDMVIDTPENHGAKRDGRMIIGTYTSSGHIFTLDGSVPSAMQFTSADEGKVFVLRNPTAGVTTVTTVDSVTDATHCVLDSGPGSNYAKTFAVLGTDDTASVAAAVSYAVSQAQELGLNAAKVMLTEGIYILNGETIKSTDTLGNAQIPLPLVSPAKQTKFALEIAGPIDASSTIHWNQTTPNLTGAVLFSTLLGLTADGTYGNPAVIGGPTRIAMDNVGLPSGWDSGDNHYSNMHIILRNFMLATPINTSYGGFDLRKVANASLDGIACLPFDSAANFGSAGPSSLTSGQVAVYMPALGNNDLCEIGSLTIYGWSYGLGVTDHVNIKSTRCIFCSSAILIAGPNSSDSFNHGWHADYISAEGCNIAIDATVFKSASDGAVNFPTTIAHMDTEVINQYHISDPYNFLTGFVWMGFINSDTKPLLNGGGNMQVRSFFQQRGHVTAPTIPATTVALTNPFWRDAAVTVTGGQVTDIAIAGTSLGIATGTVIVPSGKSIKLTYSGSGSAPAWNWVVL